MLLGDSVSTVSIMALITEEEAAAETNGDSGNGPMKEEELKEVPAITNETSTDVPALEPLISSDESEALMTVEPSPRSTTSTTTNASMVLRQTEETLQVLQSSLRQASVELLQTLGTHLSRNNLGGISLPASAVGWLASQSSLPDSNTPRLTHLRLTNAQWPPTTSASDSSQPSSPT